MRDHPRFSSPCLLLALAVTASCSSAGSRPAAPVTARQKAADPHSAVASLAARIRAADYAADRPALAKLFEEMAPYTSGPLASRARYWRGFAMWRRALNGFNDNADNAELAADLRKGIEEFEGAMAIDPRFVDAKIADASCLVNLSVLTSGPARMEGYKRHRELLDEARKDAPANPRLAWVWGATVFYSPPEFGGGQTRAIEVYEVGLEAARQERVTDSVDPSWGKPELLMNLAFANLNKTPPDLDPAERYARAALALVPTWHYVRDILTPQIQTAKRNAAGAPKT
jgi:hypothetical protein